MTPVNSNTRIIRANLMSPWVFEFGGFTVILRVSTCMCSHLFYRCLGGAKGDYCEQPAQVCETLDHVTLCVNNGECNNTKGSAICECSLGEL